MLKTIVVAVVTVYATDVTNAGVLTSEMAEKQCKHFKVSYNERKVLIPYRSYNDFISRCKEKFHIKQDANVEFTLPDDNVEVDQDCFDDFDNERSLHLNITDQHVFSEGNKKRNTPNTVETSSPMAACEETNYIELKVMNPNQNMPEISSATNSPDVSEEVGARYLYENTSDCARSIRVGAAEAKEDSNEETGSEEYKEFVNVIKRSSNKIDMVKYLQGTENNNDELKVEYEKNGLVGVASELEARLDNWEREELNIAVIGRTGVGKSAFINAIRGAVNENHPHYAKVGHSECTSERQKYPHPNNERLIFWDLPGVGTNTFKRETYLENKGLKIHSYDAFILMTSDRFTEAESWLADELMKMERMIIFVRSKVDNQIESDEKLKKNAGKVSDPKQVVQEVRDDCRKNLKEYIQDTDIYLINSLDLQYPNLDFDKLVDRLVSGFPEIKSEVILKTIGFLTPSVLEKRIQSLKERIRTKSVLSGMTGVVPIPTISLVTDTLILERETQMYRKCLGLSEDDLKDVAKIIGMSVDEMLEEYPMKSLDLSFRMKHALSSSDLIATDLGRTVASIAFPPIGIPLAAVTAYETTMKCLGSILLHMEEDAKKVLNLFEKYTGKRLRTLNNS